MMPQLLGLSRSGQLVVKLQGARIIGPVANRQPGAAVECMLNGAHRFLVIVMP